MLEKRIFEISDKNEFESLALEVFEYQFNNNTIYRQFSKLLHKTPGVVNKIQDIPFLPIEFFKTKNIVSDTRTPQTIFSSSGTTGTVTSKHHVTDLRLYEKSFLKTFIKFYGAPSDYIFLALLPSYLERQGSSLIYMADHLIKSSGNKESGFYLNDLDSLSEKLEQLDSGGKKVFLIGVSFALLDLIEKRRFRLKNTIIMETGGMKGRRKEMIREELHQHLKKGFGIENIHSEYGMTELLSQAYSKGKGVFECPGWMDILIRDPEDALSLLPEGKTGGINVIDLANINSCSFIATQDLGRIKNNEIEILGRFDNSDVRGCNLLLL
ncbi:acyltransferase [Christiangramia forsetii]|uniref:LuxE family acyl-protein synthetase n=2 Tax=Christiangramia forsetii TaxID=411153 RepID=A0LXK8_CHRFK|nr:acyltransferase [Christiangramia forsetii]GGG36571.1 acyltransferase [Christiangramia forsetii]CAL65103.1 LuxE family acyl-protein synthetase [Christiangramia forsetii KT0803]